MRFGLPSHLLGAAATITSSTAVDALYPLTNLHDGRPTDPTRWETNAETRIVWDFGEGSPATTIDGLLIVLHTFAAASIVKVQANATDAWGAPSVSVDVTVPAWSDAHSPNLVADLRATALGLTGYRYVSLLLPAGTANHGIGEVVWVGQWSEPSSSAQFPVRRAELRRVAVNSTAYGVEHVIDRGVRQRRLRLSCHAIPDADRALWLALAREAGADTAFPVVLDVHETTDFHASAEALLVRLHPETAAQLEEDLLWYGLHDVVIDLLEVQRGLPL